MYGPFRHHAPDARWRRGNEVYALFTDQSWECFNVFIEFISVSFMEPTLTPKLAPYLVVKNAPGLLRFIERGIGGKVTYELKSPNGALRHVEVRISDSLLMLAEAPEGRGNFPAMLHLYVPDVDAAYSKALKEGATSLHPPMDQPDGDRQGGVRDGWGNEWWFRTSGYNRSNKTAH
jgi:PhnB protein